MLDRTYPLARLSPSGRYRLSNKIHGWAEKPEYWAWAKIVQRCTNPGCKSYKNYGARGIRICDRWRHGEGGVGGFACFIADVGAKPSPKHSIDRIDNDGHYEPGNVRWATKKQQVNNTRRTRYVTYRGKRLPLSHVVRLVAPRISAAAIYGRLKRGWAAEAAVTTPVRRA